jgi:hypothetical protein
MHRISDMRTVSTRLLRLFKQICGDPMLKNIVIVAVWDDIPTEEQRQQDLGTVQSLFKPALDQQAQLMLHDGTKSSAHKILRAILRNHPTPMSWMMTAKSFNLGMKMNNHLEDSAQFYEKAVNGTRERVTR